MKVNRQMPWRPACFPNAQIAPGSAVETGNAHAVLDETWMTGIGVIAAGKILDDLDKYLKPLAEK
ncbi:hypothetical protein E1281_02070 [Actinomadura sp. KC345]|uniref:hypothetical protein n=1 Tax=Actinomadura sp. KC345 TaxID=2530371 RepID=UPI001047B210|nr:hypothetical protein [Actinomadura sp. KC345]TDC58306.1 hypothetical protein E1281_02070 [Actinomadura sp. KC345]